MAGTCAAIVEPAGASSQLNAHLNHLCQQGRVVRGGADGIASIKHRIRTLRLLVSMPHGSLPRGGTPDGRQHFTGCRRDEQPAVDFPDDGIDQCCKQSSFSTSECVVHYFFKRDGDDESKHDANGLDLETDIRSIALGHCDGHIDCAGTATEDPESFLRY
ncbi:MAG: hypothetical protein Q9212_005411 [Teloschistes hypoglaucus]